MANWQRQSIPVTSAMWLLLAAGIAVGIASRSVWWGVAATLVLSAGTWCLLKAVQVTTTAQHMLLYHAVERLESKLDAIVASLCRERHE